MGAQVCRLKPAPFGNSRPAMSKLPTLAVAWACAALAAGQCPEHGPIPCRFIATYDTGDDIGAYDCHMLCWDAQGDDGYWCIKESTQQCVCYYQDECGCPGPSSVEGDCTQPQLTGVNRDPHPQSNLTTAVAADSEPQTRVPSKGSFEIALFLTEARP